MNAARTGNRRQDGDFPSQDGILARSCCSTLAVCHTITHSCCSTLAVVIAFCAATTPSPSYAATTISENLTLAADTDWRANGVVTVPSGVTVDLAGHCLWLSGLAGEGAFVSSVSTVAFSNLTTTQTDDTYVKSYAGGSDAAIGSAITLEMPAWHAFQNASAYNMTSARVSYSAASRSYPIDIVYDFTGSTGAPACVNCYKLRSGNGSASATRAPKSFSFYGTNDADPASATWMLLDSRTSETGWSKDETRTYTFCNDTAYRYYRLQIKLVNDGGTGYLEFFSLEYGYVMNQIRVDGSQPGGFDNAANTISDDISCFIVGGTLYNSLDFTGIEKKFTLDGDIDLAEHGIYAYALDGEGDITTSQSAFDLTGSGTAFSTTNGVTVLSPLENGAEKYPVARVFDDDESNFAYYIDLTSQIEIGYDFGEETYVNYYRIRSGRSGNDYPKAWTFQGLDTNSEWVDLDTRSAQTFSTSGEWKGYMVASPGSYSQYRLKITQTGYSNSAHLYIYEMEFGYTARETVEGQPLDCVELSNAGLTASDLSGISWSSDVTVGNAGGIITLTEDLDISAATVALTGTIDLHGYNLTVGSLAGDATIFCYDITDAAGAATAVAPDATFYSDAGPLAGAFTNSLFGSTKNANRIMISSSSLPLAIDYDFGEAKVIDSYRITDGDNAGRGPKAWEFYGSNDDSAFGSSKTGTDGWTLLNSQSNISWTATTQTKEYSFDNTTAYRYYRMKFTVSNSSFMTIYRLQYAHKQGGESDLIAFIPSGTTNENSAVRIVNSVRLVKKGEGTLVSTVETQSYAGGTLIEEGEFQPGVSATSTTYPLGNSGSEITIATNGVFNVHGMTGFGDYLFTLAGGTLRNDVEISSKTQFMQIRLTDDSTMDFPNATFFGADSDTTATVDLGGHSVALNLGSWLRNYNVTWMDGTINMTGGSGGGFLVAGTAIDGVYGVIATNNVTLNAEGRFHLAQPIAIENLNYAWTSGTGYNNNSTQKAYIYGTFKTAVTHYHGCVMMDGSTLDLSALDAALPTPSTATTGPTQTLGFAENAAVRVLVGDRSLHTGDKLVSWAEGADPANIGTVSFTLADRERGRVAVTSTGLVFQGPGLMIMVR